MSEPSDKWVPVPDPLPSDSRRRKDLLLLEQGDLVKAQVTHFLTTVQSFCILAKKRSSATFAQKDFGSSSPENLLSIIEAQRFED